MNWSVWDIVFLVSLVVLALIPKKKLWWLLFGIVLALNLGIRVYYIHKSHALEENLKQTRQLAQAPVLTLASHEIKTTDTGYRFTLQFVPSKNEPLGIIVFQATIQGESDAKIVDFWPSISGGAFQSGPDSKKIDPDGKQAHLTYSLASAGRPTFDLTISGKAPVKIQSNYMTNALILTPQ